MELIMIALPQAFLLTMEIVIIYKVIQAIRSKKQANTHIEAKKTIKIKQKEHNNYYETEYYKETGRRYEDTITDKGRAGEYAAYRAIKNVSGYCRWLFNTYIPDPKGQTKDTEIDILLIHESGIYVIECKNYSGWIFGDEANEKWCEVFKSRKKFYFFSPILQNYRHIEYLRSKIESKADLNSIIVFSDAAVLKKVVNSNPKVKIINNRNLDHALISLMNASKTRLQPAEIDDIYKKLKGLNLQPTGAQLQQQP